MFADHGYHIQMGFTTAQIQIAHMIEELNKGEIMEGINWEEFEGKWVKLEEDEPKTLLLKDVQQADITMPDGKVKKGLSFTVVEINNKPINEDKVFETTSRLLIQELKPFVKKAEDKPFKVTITKQGSGFKTSYNVQ